MEKHYSIDAGIGEKMDGCPYSLYEDGRDVREYIIPPSGYEFIGFKLESLSNTQIYDGKLVAQYKKLPFKERATTFLLGLLLTLGILAIVGVIIGLTVSIFKPKKPQNTKVVAPVVLADTLLDAYLFEEEPDTATVSSIDDPELEAESEPEPEQIAPVEEQPKTIEADASLQFKQEFWTLIHQRALKMDDYDGLYKKYKGQVSGEEFDYLRFTILKNSSAFVEWSAKLRSLPTADLEAIETLDTLKNKFKEIN